MINGSMKMEERKQREKTNEKTDKTNPYGNHTTVERNGVVVSPLPYGICTEGKNFI